MNHLLNSRLGRRLMGCFVLLLAVVASLYAFALQASMEFTESELLSSFMHDEVVAAAKDRSFAVNIENITGTEFFGTAAHLPPIPARYAHLKEGFQEVLDEPPTFAYRLTDDQGNIYVLVRNQKDFESFEERIEQSLTVSVIVVIAIGLLVGAWLTRTVVSPIVKLSGDIKDAARSSRYHRVPLPAQGDEISDLAKICDESLQRLQDAIDREKAFTGDVSHELRTPLCIIRSSSELLSLQPLTDRQSEHVGKIHRAAEQMQELVELFLQLARHESLAQTDRVSDTLTCVVEQWQPSAQEKGLQVTLKTKHGCPVPVSPIMLATVANNLLRNAVNYTREGAITVTETSEGFEVSDTGIGMTDEEMQTVFTQHVRGKTASTMAQGNGLGLAIATRICRRCGWNLSVLRNTAGGCCFAVRIQAPESADAGASMRRDCRTNPSPRA